MQGRNAAIVLAALVLFLAAFVMAGCDDGKAVTSTALPSSAHSTTKAGASQSSTSIAGTAASSAAQSTSTSIVTENSVAKVTVSTQRINLPKTSGSVPPKVPVSSTTVR